MPQVATAIEELVELNVRDLFGPTFGVSGADALGALYAQCKTRTARKGHEWSMRLLLDWCEDKKVSATNLSLNNVKAFFRSQAQRSYGSRQSIKSSLKIQYAQLDNVEAVTGNPFTEFRLSRGSILRNDTPPAHDEDIRKVISAIQEDRFAEMRDKLLISLVYETGARAAELVALNVSDISGNQIRLCSKRKSEDSNKWNLEERWAEMSDVTQALLKRYLRRIKAVSLDEPVFRLVEARTGEAASGRVSVDRITRVFRERSYEAGLPRDRVLRPRAVRARVIKRLLSDSSEEEVQEALGFASLQSVRAHARH